VKPLSMRDNLFRGNQVRGAGIAGLQVQQACGNVFAGNNLQENPAGAFFLSSTGANVLAGDGTLVQDAGTADCDGDAVADPNVITGPGRVVKGGTFGEAVGGAMSGPAGRELR
jgi:hypothetical protein